MTPLRWAQTCICDSPTLSSTAKAVGLAMACHGSGASTPKSHASRRQLAQWTALSRRAISYAIVELEAGGYIAKVHTTKTTGATDRTLYLLTTPHDQAARNLDQLPTVSGQPRPAATRPRPQLSLHRGRVDLDFGEADPVDNAVDKPVDDPVDNQVGVHDVHPPRAPRAPHGGAPRAPLKGQGTELREALARVSGGLAL